MTKKKLFEVLRSDLVLRISKLRIPDTFNIEAIDKGSYILIASDLDPEKDKDVVSCIYIPDTQWTM